MSVQVCERIAEECHRKGESLTRVMAAAELSVSIFYRWKEGKAKPRPRSIKAIARALGIAASTLDANVSDEAEVIVQASPLSKNREESGDDSDFVFLGMRRSALKALRPFIDRLNAGLVEVPADLTTALLGLVRGSAGE